MVRWCCHTKEQDVSPFLIPFLLFSSLSLSSDRVHVVGRATVKTLEDEDGRCRFAIRIVAQKVQIILRARGS